MAMPELRWALLTLGAAFLAGLGIWEWLRSRRRRSRTPGPEPVVAQPDVPAVRRIEPGFDGLSARRDDADQEPLDVPSILPVEPVRVAIAPEPAIDVPAAARRERPEPRAGQRLEPQFEPDPVPPVRAEAPPVRAEVSPAPAAPAAPAATAAPAAEARRTPAAVVEIRWPPARTERVLSLRIVHPQGEPLSGRLLRIALEGAALVPGPQTIYHRVAAGGAVLVSAANMVRPGTLDPATMDAQQFRGVSLFSVLPGPLPPVRMLEELVAVARSLAHRLGAEVQDEQGAPLDAARLVELRRSLPEEAAGSGQDGAPA